MDENIGRREFVRVVGAGGVTVTLAGCHGHPLDGLQAEPTESTMTDQQQRETDRNRPANPWRFEVHIDGTAVPGWQSVTIPSRYIAEPDYREEADATRETNQSGRVTFDDLEMERGFTPGATELHDWFEDVRAGKADSARKEIAVKLLNEEGSVALQWEFTAAWITAYDPPQLDASADGDVATESVTIAFDEMIRTEG